MTQTWKFKILHHWESCWFTPIFIQDFRREQAVIPWIKVALWCLVLATRWAFQSIECSLIRRCKNIFRLAFRFWWVLQLRDMRWVQLVWMMLLPTPVTPTPVRRGNKKKAVILDRPMENSSHNRIFPAGLGLCVTGRLPSQPHLHKRTRIHTLRRVITHHKSHLKGTLSQVCTQYTNTKSCGKSLKLTFHLLSISWSCRNVPQYQYQERQGK